VITSVNGIMQPPLLGMVYGSRKEKSDTDLFLLYSNNGIEKAQIRNNIDCLQSGFENFLKRFSHRDIEFTEPILDGQYLYGDEKIAKWGLDYLENVGPNYVSINYLKSRALETYLQSNIFYSMGMNENFNEQVNKTPLEIGIVDILNEKNKFNNENLLRGLGVLSYSLSYLSVVKRYEDGAKKVTLKEMVNNPFSEKEFFLKELRKYYKEKELNFGPFSMGELNYFYSKTKDLLKMEIFK